MNLRLLDEVSPWATIAGFLVGLPIIVATYFQAFRARQEAHQEREGTLHSANCLEFIAGDGTCINLVPLESLHTLPKPGDVVLLPAHGVRAENEFLPGAYLVESIEHIYAHVEYKGARPNEARLTKMVAQVTSLNPNMPGVAVSDAVGRGQTRVSRGDSSWSAPLRGRRVSKSAGSQTGRLWL
jgi:hypothetical protein